MHQTHVEANLVPFDHLQWAVGARWSPLATDGVLAERGARTVPWMEKKGRPTLVCQFWGDLRMRLFSVSRTDRDCTQGGKRA